MSRSPAQLGARREVVPRAVSSTAAGSSTAIGAAAALVTYALILIVFSASSKGTVGWNEMEAPTASWAFEYGGGLVWACFLGWCVRDTLLHRRLSARTLIFVSASTMFWQEWPCDWGLYLLWNPRLRVMGWHSTWYQTANKPWAVIFGYGWFFPVVLPMMLALVRRVRNRFSHLNPVIVLVAVTVPVAFVYNLLTEPVMTALGWYSYLDTVGPALRFTKGSFPLLYPPLVLVWFWVIMVHLIDGADDRGSHRLDVLFRVSRMKEGVGKELKRLAVWVLSFNVVFAAIPVGVAVAFRILFGHDYPLVPWPH